VDIKVFAGRPALVVMALYLTMVDTLTALVKNTQVHCLKMWIAIHTAIGLG